MNKLFILVLVGVLLCAGGMIYFLHPGGNNLFVSSAPSGASAPSDGSAGPPESSSKSTPSAGKPTGAPSKSEKPTVATGASKPEGAAPGSSPSGATTPGTTTAESGKPTTPPTPTPGKPETPKPAEQPVNDAELSPSAAHALRDISVEVFEQQVIVRIEAEGPFPVKTFLLPNPNRLVVDLPGDWTNIKAPSVPQNRLIRSARLGSQSSGPRLVLDLRAPLTSRTVQRPDSNTVEITLE